MFTNLFFNNIHNYHKQDIIDNLCKLINHSIQYNIENNFQSNDLLIENIIDSLILIIKQKHPKYNTHYYLQLYKNIEIKNKDFVYSLVDISIHYKNVYIPIIILSNITYYLPILINPECIYENLRYLINKFVFNKNIFNNTINTNFLIKNFDFAYLSNRKYNQYLSKLLFYFHQFNKKNIIPLKNIKTNTITLKKNIINICFISRFLAIPHSVFKDRSGIIVNLDKTKYKVTVITEKSYNCEPIINYWKQHIIDVHYIDFNAISIKDLIQKLQKLNLDILFFCEIGMCYKQYQLAFHRIAKIQINTFGHSDTSGLPNIDYFISSKLFESDIQSHNNYSEKLIKLNSLGMYYENPLLFYNFTINSLFSKQFILQNLEIHQDSKLIVCMSTYMKINLKFIKTLYEIMVIQQQYDKNTYLIINLYGIGNTLHKLKVYIQYFQDIFKVPSILEKLIIVNNFNKHNIITKTPKFYYSLLKHANCILEPFPFGGLNSTFDALSVNQPIITLPSQFLSGRFTLGLYKKIKFYDTIANTTEEYIELAIKIINNINNLHKRCKLTVTIKKYQLFKDEQSIQEYNKILELLVYNII